LGGGSTDVYRIFVEKPEGKRPLVGPRYRWENNVKNGNFRKWNVGVWTGLIWLRIGSVGQHLRMRQ
jgi:hypothetical protein